MPILFLFRTRLFTLLAHVLLQLVSSFAPGRIRFCHTTLTNDGHGFGYESRVTTVHIEQQRASEDTVPFLIFINKKSGGRRGESLMRSFKSNLGATEICDLEEFPASVYLEKVRHSRHVRIIVCGGDGTVGRIMDTWKSISLKNCRTEFGIIPLGTGNDMFKQLVKQYRRMTKLQMKAMYCRKPSDELGVKIVAFSSPKQLKRNPSDIYRLFKDPKVIPLDRWEVSTTATDGSPTCSTTSSVTMINYFGIGVDGAVSLDFDKLRQKQPMLFFNRHINKMWYALMGIKGILKKSSLELSSSCKLICDGTEVPIPAGTLGIIALNINSYAGGSRLWPFRFRSRDFKAPNIADGILEVVAVRGILHLGLIKTGIANATPLAQASYIEVVTNETIAMQVDGEPSMVPPSRVTISLSDRSNMLIPDEMLL